MDALGYRPSSELGDLARDLVADLERLRPGLPEGATLAEAQQALGQRARLRLREIAQERCPDEEGQLALYEREIEQLLVPRYAALAWRYNQAERARAGPARDRDAFNRLAWGAIFFLIGIAVVVAPFIPIWEKWVPFLCGALAAAFAPALPDLHGKLLRRRHDLALLALLADLDRAGDALPAAPAEERRALGPGTPGRGGVE